MGEKGSHTGVFQAAVTGITDRFKKENCVALPGTDVRLEGRTCLVTGANSGLGFASAVQLAERGARIIMACRSHIPEALERLKKESGSDNAEILPLDLSDKSSINSFCGRLKGRRIDLAVMNAGTVTQKARKLLSGFDQMFFVNYLGNVILLEKLLSDGTIPNSRMGGNPLPEGDLRPRIIFVSSESHRDPDAIDFDNLGRFRDYGLKESIKEYGYTKLLLSTYAAELSRFLNPGARTDISVNHLCPGAVNTNIAREAPKFFQPLLKLTFLVFFRSPKKAAAPVIYLASSPEIEGEKSVYLHVLTRKKPSPVVLDPENGRKLRTRSLALSESVGD